MKALVELSEEFYELLQRAGVGQGINGANMPLPVFRYNKWLIHPRGVISFANRYQRDKRWFQKVCFLFYFRPMWLRCETNFQWDFAKIRDKEQKKVSFFDLKRRRKYSYWLRSDEYKQEMYAQRNFLENGVSVLPFSTCDDTGLSAWQPLKGEVFTHSDEFLPIHRQLLDYVRKTAEVHSVDEHYQYVIERQTELQQEQDELSEAIALLRSYGIVSLATVLVHGDISLENILCDRYGKAYLIDFDRSFYGSMYYDFVYAGLISQCCSLEDMKRSVMAINEQYMPIEKDCIKVAVAMFILDNYLYIVLRCKDDNREGFTRRIISRAYEYFKTL